MISARQPEPTTSNGMVLKISSALQRDLDIAAAQFLSGLFVNLVRGSPQVIDKRIITEIGVRVGKANPGKTYEEYVKLIKEQLGRAGMDLKS